MNGLTEMNNLYLFAEKKQLQCFQKDLSSWAMENIKCDVKTISDVRHKEIKT